LEAIAEFRKRLRAGELLVGAGITLADPRVTEALADSVDFVWIDTEHSAMDSLTMAGHLMAARAKCTPALVRLAAGTTPMIKTALDAGAGGVVAPQVRTPAEVAAIVTDCRYPPDGRRGFGPLVPSNYGRAEAKALAAWSNENVFVAAQIETREALENLDALVATPGLDSVVVGPSDLSFALGVGGDLEHPDVTAAVETVIAKARAAGLFVGAGMGHAPAYAAAMVQHGCQWLQVGCDFEYLIGAMDAVRISLRCHQREGS